MRLVGVNSLKPGDELARPVFTASGKIILNSGMVLKEAYIEKFKQLGINRVYIDDVRFEDVRAVQPIDITTRNEVAKVLKNAYTKIHNSEEIDEYTIKDAAKKSLIMSGSIETKG
ncbi:hypothetical protein [Acetivibrio straminisolvens]|uniref:HD-GYP domain protein n=1 Tax=Acetivibrio straminisolvens JCM 21531 TaxID=1294263 RepID=W4V7F1_9FIRM|nr:hypothetical protein [Acetivibrio straminisolvens]GAE89142.1 HD-GYP domain protein [Acetivibrio straminisolvens JCM 21531]